MNHIKIIEIEGMEFELQRKKIKNLNLRISPPDALNKAATLKISAPIRFNIKKIEQFIITNLAWIQKKKNKILQQTFKAPLKITSGETHYFFGNQFELQIVKGAKKNLALIHHNHIELHCKKHLKFDDRQKLLDNLYRQELKNRIPALIDQYEEKMGVKVKEFGVKKMKTRWGTCNPRDKRIWLALELAKRPIQCLEMIVVHEMTHLLEKGHNKRFYAFMDQFMPVWRLAEAELKKKPF